VTTPLAPRPGLGKTGITRVIYNVMHDLKHPVTREKLWEEMPASVRIPHGLKKFKKALINMAYQGYVVRWVSQYGDKKGKPLFRIATAEEFYAKRLKVNAAQQKSRAKAKKAKKKVVKPGNGSQRPLASPESGSWKEPVLQRIDKRLVVLKTQVSELEALRELFRDTQL